MVDKNNKAWENFFKKYPSVEQRIAENGYCEIDADSIKEFREPRLMTKHDSLDGVPQPLADRRLNVLSASRRSYYLGTFGVFEPFPDISTLKPTRCRLPEYETLDIEHISSESNAINALVISGILNEFLEESDTAETFNGRMGTGQFSYDIRRHDGRLAQITVNNAQLEIDGGFESPRSIIIMEAKNVIHPDFNVRQLYYPFRKYLSLVRKPIRLVFSQYTNLTYHLFEYEFADPLNFNSITLLHQAAYTFDNDRITSEDVFRTWMNTPVLYRDDKDLGDELPPFPQADSMDRIFSLMEFLSGKPDGATTDEITEFMGTVSRQAAYYPAAGMYLGMFEKPRRGVVTLSQRATGLLKLRSRCERLLAVASYMFEHEIFHQLYEQMLKHGAIPERTDIIALMRKLNVLGDSSASMFSRRASTVSAWLRWLITLPEQ